SLFSFKVASVNVGSAAGPFSDPTLFSTGSIQTGLQFRFVSGTGEIWWGCDDGENFALVNENTLEHKRGTRAKISGDDFAVVNYNSKNVGEGDYMSTAAVPCNVFGNGITL